MAGFFSNSIERNLGFEPTADQRNLFTELETFVGDRECGIMVVA